MRYYQYIQGGTRRVGVETESGQIADLTALNPRIGSTLDLLKTASITGSDIDSVTRGVLSINPGPGAATISVEEFREGAAPGKRCIPLLPPIAAPAGAGQHDSPEKAGSRRRPAYLFPP